MQKKKIIVLVSSDLITDNRVARTCTELHELGCDVLLIGRKKKSSNPILKRAYKTKRISTFFEKGPLFYISLNIQFFIILFFKKLDGIYANDLDTLLPAYLISKLKNIPLVYDSHELFTEVPELENRPFVRSIWLKVEQTIFPKLKHVITVNYSIAREFQRKYPNSLSVIRNVPIRYSLQHITRSELGIPEEKFILVIQGSGLNIGRGVEEAIEALSELTDCLLLIVGDGDVIPKAKLMVSSLQLEHKVLFIPRIPYPEMMKYTEIADLGLSLDRAQGLNYIYSLPNKVFDYIHAHTPVLCTNLIEVATIINNYECGVVLEDFSTMSLSNEIKNLAKDKQKMIKLKENCKKAACNENWENERKILHSVIREAFF